MIEDGKIAIGIFIGVSQPHHRIKELLLEELGRLALPALLSFFL